MNPWPLIRAGFVKGAGLGSALALLIGLSVALSIAVTSTDRSWRKAATRAGDAFDVLVVAPGSPTQAVLSVVYLRPGTLDLIPGAVLEKLRKDPGVAYAAPVSFGDFYKGHAVIGTSTELATKGGTIDPLEGRGFMRITDALAGSRVRMSLGTAMRLAHGQHGDIDNDEGHGPEHAGLEFTLVGRLKPTGTPWDDAILVPIEAIWFLHNQPTGHNDDDPNSWVIGTPGPQDISTPLGSIPAIVVKPKSIADAYRLRQTYRTKETLAVFTGEVLADLFRTLGDMRDLLALLGLGVQALVLAAVLLASFAALEQRRRTLGVLRALGASRGFVFSILWGHVGVIVMLGVVIGIALGVGATLLIGEIASARTGIDIALQLSVSDIGKAALLPAIAIIAASIPAWLLGRQTVISQLR
jgi:putative ABC transport system permease protein